MTNAFVFPGQGSRQSVGMGKAIYDAYPEARKVFRAVDKALDQNLTDLMFKGPAEKLNFTANIQPALFAVSMAIFRVLEARGDISLPKDAAFVAGHSLGQYTALCAAESLMISDAAKLLRARGEAMQRAVPVGGGAMVALIGGSLEIAREIALEAAKGEVCSVALNNAPEQQVLSGTVAAIERALELAPKYGIEQSVKLSVSVPSHCTLMAPAIDNFAGALKEVTLRRPVVPLFDNASGKPYKDPDTIRNLLLRQMTDCVRWEETMKGMQDRGVTHLVECGEGRVLSGLAKIINKDIKTTALSTPNAIESFIQRENTNISARLDSYNRRSIRRLGLT